MSHNFIGSAHQLVPIAELVSILKSKIEEMNTDVIKKEDELASLCKKILKQEAEFSEETKRMIQQLHRIRDEQVSDI